MTADFKTGASLAGKILKSGLLGLIGANTAYTVGANEAVKIATCVLCNTGGSTATISVNVVPSGGTVGAGNRVISGYGLAAGDSIQVTEIVGALLDAGVVISVDTDTSNVVACTITGAVSS